MEKMMINYNKRLDVLYVNLKDKSNSYGDESTNGLILMRDMNTEDITGFTVIGFRAKYSTHILPLLPNGIGISWEKDIIPQLSGHFN